MLKLINEYKGGGRLMKKSIKILGNFFCVILSAVFIILAVMVPFYYSITGLTVPKTVTEVVQGVDYKTVIEKTPAIKSALKKSKVTTTTVEKFMKSPQASELIEVYADEATEILLDIPKDRMFDVELIKEIAEEHVDDFVKIAEEKTGKNYSEKKIKKNVDTFIEKNEEQIEKSIPVIETTRKVVKTIHESNVIEQRISLKTILILSAVTCVILLCIFITKRFRGCIWMGINCLIASVLLAALLVFSQSNLISMLALKLSSFNVEIIESAITICSEKVAIAFFSTAIGSFVFVTLFAITYSLKRRKSIPDENSEPQSNIDLPIEPNSI